MRKVREISRYRYACAVELARIPMTDNARIKRRMAHPPYSKPCIFGRGNPCRSKHTAVRLLVVSNEHFYSDHALT
jgi:hypothetical protein